jgi:tetratricopeptide (TPR) repeat protein
MLGSGQNLINSTSQDDHPEDRAPMRLSINVISPQSGTASSSPPAHDGRKLSSRLAGEDASFDVVHVDPGRDLAEQLESVLANKGVGWRDSVLFYASCPVLLSVDGELFLSLDPAAPNVADALADVAAVLRDQAPGPKLLVLDLVDPKLGADPARAEALVRAAEAAVEPGASGIELVLAARSFAEGAFDGSPLADALVAELDAMEKGRGLTARGLYDRLQRKLREALPLIYHARGGKLSFELVPLRGGKPSVPPEASRPSAVPPATDGAPEGAAAKEAPAVVDVAAFRPPPPPEAVDFAWSDDGSDELLIAPVRRLAAPPGASLPPPPAPPPVSTADNGPASGPRSGPISGRNIGISPLGRYTVEGELCVSQGDFVGAIAAFRKALSVLGPAGEPDSRAEMYARIGELRAIKGDTDDAISDFEKALALRPGHVFALESLLQLCAAERDWRGVMSAEERLLVALPSDTQRFERLIEFAARWEGAADKPGRARHLFERARELRPHDPIVLEQIRRLTIKSIPPMPR